VNLLVSVRNAEEALSALRGGADWIDLKEPWRGPLGAVDAATAGDVTKRLKGRVPISAAAGELVDWRHGVARELLAVEGVSLLKLGLSRCRAVDWRGQWHAARHEILARGRTLVAVIYADADRAEAPAAHEIAELAIRARCAWLLVDTFDKSAGALGDYIDEPALREHLRRAREAGCRTVVAGSLSAAAMARLPLEMIDMIAVRGAACDGGRHGVVSRRRVAQLRALASATACG